MAGELLLDYGTTGATLYALIFDSTGKVWNGATFETLAAANWATYDVAMVEGSTTGVYVGSFPSISAGTYGVSYRLRAGGSPATTDTVVGSGQVEWTGAAVAAPSGNYTTTAAVKTLLGITAATDDALIATLIARAQAWIESFCDQVFEAAADSTRKFDAHRDVEGGVLYLDYPLASITSITNGDGVVVASTEYVTEPRNRTPYRQIRLLSSKCKFWARTPAGDSEDAITIVGKWAFGTSAPADVVQACERLAAYMYRQKDSQVFDVTADADTGQLTIPKGMPPDVRQMLLPYRRLA